MILSWFRSSGRLNDEDFNDFLAVVRTLGILGAEAPTAQERLDLRKILMNAQLGEGYYLGSATMKDIPINSKTMRATPRLKLESAITRAPYDARIRVSAARVIVSNHCRLLFQPDPDHTAAQVFDNIEKIYRQRRIFPPQRPKQDPHMEWMKGLLGE